MRYTKNGGVAPGSGKTQCSSIGQKPEQGSGKGWMGEQREGRGLMGLSGSEGPERGNHLKCK